MRGQRSCLRVKRQWGLMEFDEKVMGRAGGLDMLLGLDFIERDREGCSGGEKNSCKTCVSP